MLVTGCIFCLQVDGPITGVRAYELGGGGGGARKRKFKEW